MLVSEWLSEKCVLYICTRSYLMRFIIFVHSAGQLRWIYLKKDLYFIQIWRYSEYTKFFHKITSVETCLIVCHLLSINPNRKSFEFHFPMVNPLTNCIFIQFEHLKLIQIYQTSDFHIRFRVKWCPFFEKVLFYSHTTTIALYLNWLIVKVTIANTL